MMKTKQITHSILFWEKKRNPDFNKTLPKKGIRPNKTFSIEQLHFCDAAHKHLHSSKLSPPETFLNVSLYLSC